MSMYQSFFLPILIQEALKRKVVIRGGKRIVKKVTDKPGYKVVGGKEQRMKPSEIRARHKSAIKSARKKKSHQAQITRKRNKSMKKRSSF